MVSICASYGFAVAEQREFVSYDDRNVAVTGTGVDGTVGAKALLKISHCTTPQQRVVCVSVRA